MAEEKETKKIEELKKTPENKKAVAESEGGKVESVSEKKSQSAVEKIRKTKKEKANKNEVAIEREYVVPLRKGSMKVPAYKRAKKAVKTLKEFIARHMKVRDRDLRKVKVDINLNNEIWFRGIKKPLHKIKVKAVKKEELVTVTLADPSEYVKFRIAREEKNKAALSAPSKAPKTKKVEEKDKDKDGVEDEVEEREDKKAGEEKAVKDAKVEAKVSKHTATGKHAQKTAPVRKTLR